MGGRILEYEAKRIKSEGLQEGIAEGRIEGKIEGRMEGRIEGQIETLIELVKDKILSVQDAASRACLSEAGFREQMRKHGV